jgi:uncharacterized membrane protein YbhN (UPF0104 family)
MSEGQRAAAADASAPHRYLVKDGSSTGGLRRVLGSKWFRAVVSVGLLVLVSSRVDWQLAARTLSDGHWGWAVGAVFLLALAQWVGAVRWHGLVVGAGVSVGLWAAARAYLIGVFLNNFLFTSFGGDAARTWLVGRSERRFARVLISVAVDRASALGCLVVIAWAAIALNASAVPLPLMTGLAALTIVGALLTGLLVALARFPRGLSTPMPAVVARAAGEARTAVDAYRGKWRLAAQAFVLGCVFQLLGLGATWMLARSIELPLPFALAAAVVPLVLLVMLVPVSVAGWGVREGGFVGFLAVAGVGATDALLLSLLSATALAVASLPGALVMLSPRPASRAVVES